MSDPHRDLVRQAFERYVATMPGVSYAYLHDVATHAAMKQMEHMLVATSRAMETEGLDLDARRRVISTALFGGPDEEAAVQRIDEVVQVFGSRTPHEGDMRGFGLR
jgi:hypothetical protein